MNKKLVFTIGFLAVFLLIAGQALAASVNVYAKGMYTNDSMDLYIYADISEPILSFGIKVTFDPTQLKVDTAEKNIKVWYMGDQSPGYTYMDPVVNGGDVIIIGGKLDTNDPQSGVSGSVLLGKVHFVPTDNGTFNPCSTITLGFGKDGTYKNFVTPDGIVLDDSATGVSFGSVEARLLGDLTGDNIVNALDYGAFRGAWGNTGVALDADFNADGVVNALDYGIFRQQWGKSFSCPQ